ncbi:uncharacterized protein LOC134217934 [Armigeres subalbatus]|uniref:uncharacterized protein LOC134217934 n=1 Tax=Armigeres subalbatus TaxID=124917 RepID=UPI002ED1F55B
MQSRARAQAENKMFLKTVLTTALQEKNIQNHSSSGHLFVSVDAINTSQSLMTDDSCDPLNLSMSKTVRSVTSKVNVTPSRTISNLSIPTSSPKSTQSSSKSDSPLISKSRKRGKIINSSPDVEHQPLKQIHVEPLRKKNAETNPKSPLASTSKVQKYHRKKTNPTSPVREPDSQLFASYKKRKRIVTSIASPDHENLPLKQVDFGTPLRTVALRARENRNPQSPLPSFSKGQKYYRNYTIEDSLDHLKPISSTSETNSPLPAIISSPPVAGTTDRSNRKDPESPVPSTSGLQRNPINYSLSDISNLISPLSSGPQRCDTLPVQQFQSPNVSISAPPSPTLSQNAEENLKNDNNLQKNILNNLKV